MTEETLTTPAEATMTKAPETFKVFVGNLVYSTKDSQLKEFFSTKKEVLSANVIRALYKSLGYGFVEFRTLKDAEEAVKEFDKKELCGREINVEMARPRDSNSTPIPKKKSSRKGKDKPKKSKEESVIKTEDVIRDEETEIKSSSNEEDSANKEKKAKSKSKAKSVPRKPRTINQNRQLSETTLIVKNIPYEANDEDLKGYFEGYNPIEARVITSPSGRSKGFGFVIFENSQQQNDALSVQGKTVSKGPEDKKLKLSVKIAYQPSSQTNNVSEQSSPQTNEQTPQN